MVDLRWGVSIPLRDGVRLAATLYLPDGRAAPSSAVFTLTPYVADNYHERGMYFAERGLTFLTVNARGRGGSEGDFTPLIQEIDDAFDVVEWIAAQPWCDGRVGMWGGSYGGYAQWAAAKRRPPHLATIVPVASAFPGVDFPMRNNISVQYLLQWLTLVSGPAAQNNLFADAGFWKGLWRKRFEAGEPFSNLEFALGGEQPAMRAWLAHPSVDAYFDAFTPTPAEFAAIDLPILTITGAYDDDQPGALAFYNAHLAASPAARRRHYLVIGPWDHAGTRTPRPSLGGLGFGPESLLDLPALHLEWYAWTMGEGPRPAFLKAPVAYYVMGAETWRYAQSLAEVTAGVRAFFLASSGRADSLYASGDLGGACPTMNGHDAYAYDPREVSVAPIEVETDLDDPTDQRLLHALDGKHLVYHSAPFDEAVEFSGFFRLKAWIAIDQPDTDLQVKVFELTGAGQSILLTTDQIRARYREGPRNPRLVETTEPLLYDFNRFTFTARRLAKGSRLRLTIGPINSILVQKNYNAARPVSEQSLEDARTVIVRLAHGPAFPSVLEAPIGAPA